MQLVHSRRFISAFLAACCGLLAAAAGFALVRAGGSLPAPVSGFAWLMVILMVVGLLIGLRDTWRPPLMYRADERGVTIFYQADRRRFAGPGVFLPWDSVTKLTLEKRICRGHTARKVNIWVVVCALDREAPFPVAQHSSACEDEDHLVCLDAVSGTPSGEEMLARLRNLWARGKRRRRGAKSP
ncbi:hypothetical protein AzCIB_2116 [Azoarcus sp. CIB]|uniref:hypothetical protein n=1 Tax=Aromatoleum sp. (strain CIB) TaxID=198107 RepID=UPI00067E56F1|nr:hypothetical protein [Azoarcus sp. CIB]AKU12011.1 hypothetical protein AzCIB_2116 [Azoarcus sp. CIB]